MDELIYANGLDFSGKYLLPPILPADLAARISGVEPDSKEIKEYETWLFTRTQAHYGLKEGDPSDLAQAGWGVIFPQNSDPAIRDALKELLDWRQEQAGRKFSHYYKEFSGAAGYQKGETKLSWLSRHGMGPGLADPNKVPYYLMIVGDPETIPFRFQNQLDVQYGTGRIYFERLEDYAQYAHSVVQAEKNQLTMPRNLTFFGANSPDDGATILSSTELVAPLAAELSQKYPGLVRSVPVAETKKERLASLLGGSDTPALLFSASHGMGFPKGHTLQKARQGALVTSDWPGPKQWQKEIPEDFYFSADDLSSDANVFGLMVFLFACYGAGTPRYDEFAVQQLGSPRAEIAPSAFLSELPTRLLAHPKGGALAVIGHIDRAWGYSFHWGQAGRQLGVFTNAFDLLLKGMPIGGALDAFNQRFAEVSTELSGVLEDAQFGKRPDPRELSALWTATNDARDYIILGDPAVRLQIAPQGSAPTGDRSLQPVEFRAEESAPDKGIITTMFINAGEILPPISGPGRLYSLAMDKSYSLPPLAEITLGRHDATSANNPDIDLGRQGEAGVSVSRKHAQMVVEGEQVFLIDLHSTNFTYINDEKLEPGKRYLLKNGDELKFGGVFLIFFTGG